MTIRFLILSLVLFITSCNYQNPWNVPEEKVLIPTDSLVKIIYEIHINQEALTSLTYKNLYPGITRSDISDTILKKHGYNKAQFDTTLSALSNNPKKLEEIYNEAISLISIEEGKMQDTSSTRLR